MNLDPAKRYAELRYSTNIVEAVFYGKSIPDWAARGRKIIEVPEGATVEPGYTYNNGIFRPPLS